MNCTLCQNTDEWLITSRFCSKCKRIKHLLNLYKDDVYKTLEVCLVRTEAQQENKIKTTIKPVIKRELADEKEKKPHPHYAQMKPASYKNINK